MAKCYFAKHKLGWKSLMAVLRIRLKYSGRILTQLSRRPLFFRETNPQPRKHTLWQASSDFTGGQASVYRYFIFIKLSTFYYYLTQTYDLHYIWSRSCIFLPSSLSSLMYDSLGITITS